MRITKVLVGLAAVVGLTVGVTLVAAGQGGPEGGPAPNTGQNPNARMQALVLGTSNVGTVGIQRRKNVQALTNPAVGVFCLQPTTASGITPSKAVPNITMGSASATEDVLVTWRVQRSECPIRNFEFVAYDLSTGSEENLAKFAVTVG
jgi:hypothetical protein